jgi:hypothetical protein
VTPAKSWICPMKLLELAMGLGYKERVKLDRVLLRMRQGADLWCVGAGRLPTRIP